MLPGSVSYDISVTLDIDMMVDSGSLSQIKQAAEELGFAFSAVPMEFHGGAV